MNFQKNTLRQTIIIGVFFLLLVTTYVSFSNIITFVFQHDSKQYPFTGTLSLILNYVVYLLGLTWAASLRNFKRQFQIAAVCYTINYALYLIDFNELIRLIISVVGAIIGGYGASVLWVSQGGYMVKLFKKYHINQSDQGKYLGILNGIVHAQIICGGVITTFALGIFGNFTYFAVLTILGLISFFFCRFSLDSLLDPQQKQPQQNSATCSNYWAELIKVLKYYPQMKYIIPAMILDGILLGFTTTNFSQLLPKPIANNFNVGLLHISNGVGGIIGGYLSGYLSDKMHILNQGVILFLFTILSLLITLFKELVDFQTIAFSLVITFLWGIAFCFLQGWLFVCCIKLFNGKIQSFAVVKQLHTVSFIIFQVYMIVSGMKIHFFGTVAAMLVLSITCCIICYTLSQKKQNNHFVQEIVCDHSPQLQKSPENEK